MFNKKTILTTALTLGVLPLFAEGTMELEWVSNKTLVYSLYFLGIILFLMIVMLGKTLSHLNAHFNKDKNEESRLGFWEQLFQVKAISTDKDTMMDHEYDGIRELDNPPPPWFMFLFYGTIVVAVIYFYRYSISGAGPTQAEEYQTELLEADAAKAAKIASSPPAGPEITASTATFSDAADVLKAGKMLYNTNCKVCHADAGKGLVGPNLTDKFWKNGGSVKEIFTTISEGVPPNMTAWGGSLTGKQISDVTNYILNLELISEADGGKAPEGEEYVPAEEPTEEAATESADSTESTEELEPPVD